MTERSQTTDPRLAAVVAVINGWSGTKTVESLAVEILAAVDQAADRAKARALLAHRPDLLAEFNAKLEEIDNVR